MDSSLTTTRALLASIEELNLSLDEKAHLFDSARRCPARLEDGAAGEQLRFLIERLQLHPNEIILTLDLTSLSPSASARDKPLRATFTTPLQLRCRGVGTRLVLPGQSARLPTRPIPRCSGQPPAATAGLPSWLRERR